MAVADTGINLFDVPVKALGQSTRSLLSTMLNPPKVIPTEDNLLRDWQGLAALAGFSQESILAASFTPDPTERVLNLWKEGTVGFLQEYLGQIDRWDVVDDTAEMFEADARAYLESVERASTSAPEFDRALDKEILTTDDIIRLDQQVELQRYHAFLLYADDDRDFATEIVDKMENEYNLKLCLRDRDLVGGLRFEHEAIMKLISERCDRLIAIISPSFLESEMKRYLVTFGTALGIDQKTRKVIPVVYKGCTLPLDLNYYFPLNYSRSGKLWNFWDKLYSSIQTPKPQRNGFTHNHTSLSESEVYAVKKIPGREIVSAPIEPVQPVDSQEKWASSCSDIYDDPLPQYNLSSSNLSLSKKSFSRSMESLKVKVVKFFTEIRPVSNTGKRAGGGKRRRRKEGAISEC